MNIFLDTNVVIDFLANREPFADSATEIFNLSEEGHVKLYISAVSYNNIYYILRRSLTNAAVIKILEQLCELTSTQDVTASIISNSLKSNFKDFEDAIQYNCALSVPKLYALVTRDTKDFRKSNIPVLTPDELLGLIKNKNQ